MVERPGGSSRGSGIWLPGPGVLWSEGRSTRTSGQNSRDPLSQHGHDQAREQDARRDSRQGISGPDPEGKGSCSGRPRSGRRQWNGHEQGERQCTVSINVPLPPHRSAHAPVKDLAYDRQLAKLPVVAPQSDQDTRYGQRVPGYRQRVRLRHMCQDCVQAGLRRAVQQLEERLWLSPQLVSNTLTKSGKEASTPH